MASSVAAGVHSEPVGAVAALAVPIVQAAEPVLEVAAPLREVAAPVGAAVGQAVPPVSNAVVSLAGALDPLLIPVADAHHPLLGTGLIGSPEPPDTDYLGLTKVVRGSSAGPAGAGPLRVPAGADVDLAAGRGPAAGVPGPVRSSTPAGGPARAACAGAYSFDQSPADLPSAVLATVTAALVAAGDARDAAGNIASDPSFSPD